MRGRTNRRWRSGALLLGALLGFAAGCSDAGPDTAEGGAQPPHPGEAIYNRSCFSCHAAGVANAPRPGDAKAWAPRLAKGRALLLESVRAGMPPGMPPGGLCSGCSEAELAAALDYMLSR